MSWSEPDDGRWEEQDPGWEDPMGRRWPLDWRGLYPRERWIWFERLWTNVCTLRERYRLSIRSGWWEDQIQVEALAALAAWTDRYDSGEWDDPPGKLALLYDLERIAALLRDGDQPFHPDRDRVAFAAYLIDLGCQPPPTRCHARCVPDQRQFPIGASVTIEELEHDPHPVLARLREREPVSWVPVLDGWLVTTHAAALAVMRDADTFTVDDPRFSTAQVIGASMLSLDGEAHDRHRAPFAAPFRPVAVSERFAAVAALEAERLIELLEPNGAAELRRAFAGPLAASIVGGALGLAQDEIGSLLGWYDAIVGAVTAITAGGGAVPEGERAFAELHDRLGAVIDGGDRSSALGAAAAHGALTRDQLVSNAAVLLFGGIETTEGTIANAVLHLLERPSQLELVRDDPKRQEASIEESLRLEPAAAVVDRYATTPATLEAASIRAGDLVRVSISAANRDPAVFPKPDDYELERPRRHLAFAHGPHVCLGVHLARLEARAGLGTLLRRLPRLRPDPAHPAEVTGLVFRKPQTLMVRFD